MSAKPFVEKQIPKIEALPQIASAVVLERSKRKGKIAKLEVCTKGLISSPVWRQRYSMGVWKITYTAIGMRCLGYEMELECLISGRKDGNTNPEQYLYKTGVGVPDGKIIFCFGDNGRVIGDYLERRELFAATELITDCLAHVGQHKESDVRTYYCPVGLPVGETRLGRLSRLAYAARHTFR